MRSRHRLGLVILIGVLTSSTVGATSLSASSTEEGTLLTKYLPVLASPRQPTECGRGEPYFPIAVEDVLNRDDVVMRDARRRATDIAPMVDDLATADSASYLDFPGRALKPACTYERWFDSLGASPTVYGRLARDSDHPDQLVVQYWFFWVYNDWNDRHEGDWEMVQFMFDTPDISRALEGQPTQVMVAQHEGGEIRAWEDIAMWDDRPLFFPAAGSHATYFSAGRWLGTDAQSGFGCDDTGTPSRIISPELRVLPANAPVDPRSDLAWVNWRGRWGERQPSFNNGPTGPITKDQWSHPVTWFEEHGREASVALPPLGTPVTNAFCTVASHASLAMFEMFDRPWLASSLTILLVCLLVWAVRRTSWTPSSPFPVGQYRDSGAMWIAAARLLTRRWRRFLPFAAILFVAGAMVRYLQNTIVIAATSSDLSSILDERSRLSSSLVTVTWLIITIPAVALVLSSIVVVFDEERRDLSRSRFIDVIGCAVRPSRFLPCLVFSIVMLVTVLPVYGLVAVFPAIRWMVAPVLTDCEHPFRRSGALTKGRRIRCFRVGATTLFLSVFLAPALGTLLLVTTTVPLGLLNTLTSAVAALMLPWAMVSMCLFRETLEALSARPSH